MRSRNSPCGQREESLCQLGRFYIAHTSVDMYSMRTVLHTHTHVLRTQLQSHASRVRRPWITRGPLSLAVRRNSLVRDLLSHL